MKGRFCRKLFLYCSGCSTGFSMGKFPGSSPSICRLSLYAWRQDPAHQHVYYCRSWKTFHSSSTFQRPVLNYLKITLAGLKKVHYFSDGCPGQYKNQYNFINLCHHKEDSSLDCEWNFFAISHGKSACDGIGGTVKRLTAKASLQRPVDRQILNPREMFNFCTKSLPGIAYCCLV